MNAQADRSNDRIHPQNGETQRAVLITSTEPEPRKYGKSVVLGGILDHLCDRLGPSQVHLVLIGRCGQSRPSVAYHRHVLAKPPTTTQLRALVRDVILPPRPGGYRRSLQEAALHLSRLRASLDAVIRLIRPDLEIWDTVRTGQYVGDHGRTDSSDPRVTRPRRRILYADDLFSERYARMLEETDAGGNPGGEFVRLLPGPARRLLASPLVHRPLLRLERDLVAASEERQPAWFDSTYLISPQETARLAARCPSQQIETLPPLLREPAQLTRKYQGAPEFTFIGGFDYAPNVDGLDWFLRECAAPLRERLPDAVINVVGPGTERGLASAQAWGSAVRFLGWVDDLDAVLAGSAALLSPLRTGSGVKIKVLEALARGLPVIATPAGHQGIDGGENSGCLIGKNPTELAAAMQAATDPSTNQRLSEAARAAWNEHYSPAVVKARYDEIFGLRDALRDSTQTVRTAGNVANNSEAVRET